MRRSILLLMVIAATLVTASGVALAVVRSGGPGDDTLRGTNGPDTLSGGGGDDEIYGRAGGDTIDGGAGRDIVLGGLGADTLAGSVGDDFLSDGPFPGDFQRDVLGGGTGNDEVSAFNSPASRDIVGCGTGRDYAEVDRKDIVGDDCERVRFF